MNANFDSCLGLVLGYEGGFVNNPKDPGGMTNLGVTRHVWEGWIGHPVTDRDMRCLMPSDVRPLYMAKYWDMNKCGDLPNGIDLVVFDTSVNSGVTRAARILQQVLQLDDDGIIGPKTLHGASTVDAKGIIEAYCDTRIAFLKSLGTWRYFGNGWSARVEKLRSTALSMV